MNTTKDIVFEGSRFIVDLKLSLKKTSDNKLEALYQ